jgi:GntR family transcriptional regulator
VFRFDLSPASATPLYRQIVDQVTHAVAARVLREGDELPSVRAAALDYVINPMTVSKAYSLLEQQGVVERRRGLGMVIRAQPTSVIAERLALLQPALDQAVAVAQQLGITPKKTLAALQKTFDVIDKDKHKDKDAPNA